jgi:hypothetical protein
MYLLLLYEMDLESTLSSVERGSEVESFRAPCYRGRFSLHLQNHSEKWNGS